MLLVFQSIIVYGLMIWVMTRFGKIAYKNQYPQGFYEVDRFKNKKMTFASLLTKSYFFIPIFVFCLFSAIRYKVGVDFDAYKRFFYEILNFGRVLDEGAVEPAFTYIAKFTAIFTDNHYLLFFILAFLQISFIYYALRKKTYALVYLGLAIMLNFTYHSLMNGVRQNVVACAFVAMIPLVLKIKKWPWFILCVLATALMHKSAVILLPIGLIVYLILQRGILSVPIQLVIVAICFIFMDKIDSGYIDSLFMLGEKSGYSTEKVNAYVEQELMEKSFGAWAIISNLAYIITIVYSNKIKLWLNNDKVYMAMYNLFFLSVCIDLLFYNNFGIGRLNLYLKIFQPVAMSIMLFYTSIKKNKFDIYIHWGVILILSIKLISLFFMMAPIIGENTLYKFDLFR